MTFTTESGVNNILVGEFWSCKRNLIWLNVLQLRFRWFQEDVNVEVNEYVDIWCVLWSEFGIE